MKQMHYTFISFFVLLFSTVGISANTVTGTEHFTVKRLNDTLIDAYLSKPSGADDDNKVALVLSLKGSGCNSISGSLDYLNRLIDINGEKKFASLLAEKAGVQFGDTGDNCSAEFDRHNTIPQRIFDLSRIIEHLRATASWWNHELYIVGGSQGGAEAAILAAFIPETKKVAIFIAGGGLTLIEMMLMRKENEMRKQGASQAEIDLELQKTRKFSDKRKAKFSLDMYHIRTLNVLVDVTIPIYMVAATEDINDAVLSSRKTVDTFKALGKDNLLYREYQGLDHSFIDSQGISHGNEIYTEIYQWLLTD